MPSTRVLRVVSAVANVDGRITLVFEPPPAGYVITGSVTTPDSANDQTWIVGYGPSAEAAPVAAFYAGKGPFATVQLWAPDTLIVAGDGFTAGDVQRAILIGGMAPAPYAQPLGPIALATPINIA